MHTTGLGLMMAHYRVREPACMKVTRDLQLNVHNTSHLYRNVWIFRNAECKAESFSELVGNKVKIK